MVLAAEQILAQSAGKANHAFAAHGKDRINLMSEDTATRKPPEGQLFTSGIRVFSEC
jgi:hypothetical protein